MWDLNGSFIQEYLSSFVSIFPPVSPAALQRVSPQGCFLQQKATLDPAWFSDNWKKWNCLTWDLKGVPRPCDGSSFPSSRRSTLVLELLPVLLVHAIAQAAIWVTLPD